MSYVHKLSFSWKKRLIDNVSKCNLYLKAVNRESEGFCADVKPIKNVLNSNIDKVVLKCGCGEMESSVKDFMEKKTQCCG